MQGRKRIVYGFCLQPPRQYEGLQRICRAYPEKNGDFWRGGCIEAFVYKKLRALGRAHDPTAGRDTTPVVVSKCALTGNIREPYKEAPKVFITYESGK